MIYSIRLRGDGYPPRDSNRDDLPLSFDAPHRDGRAGRFVRVRGTEPASDEPAYIYEWRSLETADAVSTH